DWRDIPVLGFESRTLLKSVLAAMGVPFLWCRRRMIAQINTMSKAFDRVLARLSQTPPAHRPRGPWSARFPFS
ncbi:MAG: hypothetical protein ACE1Y4_05935, partial [Lysobacterales bacterium]